MMKGKIVFELTNVGSKSQGEFPFLVVEEGKKIKIGFRGDNPFEQPTLHLYEGKDVVVEGEFNENGKFIATSISEVVCDVECVCEEQVCDEEECCCNKEESLDQENCCKEEENSENENCCNEENSSEEL
ncbi:MAG: hypothetical protein IKA72_02990 [Clostridia bacterium]|nr:hypothetical protein [Clostridia bacterium]